MNEGWLLVDRTGGSRSLLRSTDSGRHWITATAPEVIGAQQVVFADTTNGWIVGDKGLQSTHDGGATWATTGIPGGVTTAAAVTASNGRVHVAYIGHSGISIASSPIERDAFVSSALSIPFGAGPRLDLSMSAGGSYGALVYNDRTFIGAAEIRDGQWAKWNFACPYDNPSAAAGLSPHGQALTIACSPSGFGENAPVVGANLSTGTITWVTIEPAGNPTEAPALVDFATATDAGVRIIGVTKADGVAEIVASTDRGATWPQHTPLPAGTAPIAATHLPDGSLIISTDPNGGLASPDGLTWTPVATTPG